MKKNPENIGKQYGGWKRDVEEGGVLAARRAKLTKGAGKVVPKAYCSETQGRGATRWTRPAA